MILLSVCDTVKTEKKNRNKKGFRQRESAERARAERDREKKRGRWYNKVRADMEIDAERTRRGPLSLSSGERCDSFLGARHEKKERSRAFHTGVALASIGLNVVHTTPSTTFRIYEHLSTTTSR